MLPHKSSFDELIMVITTVTYGSQLEDSRVVLDQTNLVLVPVNNVTVSSWYVISCTFPIQSRQYPQEYNLKKNLHLHAC